MQRTPPPLDVVTLKDGSAIYGGAWLKDMTLHTKASLSYFNEDFTTAPDKSSFRGRWSIKFNWSSLDEKMTLYHFQERFPALQDTKGHYIVIDCHF